jgi:hypothetical protein
MQPACGKITPKAIACSSRNGNPGFYSIAAASSRPDIYFMKIALLLSIVCATAIVSGCSTTNNTGGTANQPEYMYGSGVQTSPAVSDPSLPQDPNVGPTIPPP